MVCPRTHSETKIAVNDGKKTNLRISQRQADSIKEIFFFVYAYKLTVIKYEINWLLTISLSGLHKNVFLFFSPAQLESKREADKHSSNVMTKKRGVDP